MINLLTGAPGASKTLNAIKMLFEHPALKGRDIYTYNLNGMNVPEWNELTEEEVYRWWDLPPKSVILIDEAQDIWRPMHSSKKIPEHLEKLEKHRHYSIDFVLTCQYPKQLHNTVRQLVGGAGGEHIHFFRPFGMDQVTKYTFQKCQDMPDSASAKKVAKIERVPIDSTYFSKYKSAEVHTVKEDVPFAIYYKYIALAFLILMGIGLYYFAQHLSDMGNTEHDQPKGETHEKSNSRGYSYEPDTVSKALTTEQYLDTLKPRILNAPETAPRYDEARPVKSYPRKQCTYNHHSGVCRCYTQQATRLHNVDRRTCLYHINNGFSFDSTMEDIALNQSGDASGADDRGTRYTAPIESPIGQLTSSSVKPIRPIRFDTSVPHPNGYRR